MSRKKEEIIERSKFIFGEDTFDYSKIPDDIDSLSKITLLCKKCGNDRTINVAQHLSKYYGCKYCKNTYQTYDPKDTKEEEAIKLKELEEGLLKIKEKYKRKVVDSDRIIRINIDEKVAKDLKVIFEKNNDLIKNSELDVMKFLITLHSNGFKLIKI